MARFFHSPIEILGFGARYTPASRSLSSAKPVSGHQRPMAALLFAAMVAAMLVVADQLVSTWADGHLLVAWIVLWTIAFGALAFLVQPIARLATVLGNAYAQWRQGVEVRRQDEYLWNFAQGDHRVMAELQAAVGRDSDPR